MNRRKLHKSFATPTGITILIATFVLLVEMLFMELLHSFLMVHIQLSNTAWSLIDAAVLTVILAPALYFLVFRNLQKSEARLQQLYASARDAIVTTDAACRITSWNPAAQQMFQYRSEEAIGQPLHELIIPARYRDKAAREFTCLDESSKKLLNKATELTMQRQDGSEFFVELSLSAVDIENQLHVMGIIRDITERKHLAERAAALLELVTTGETLDQKAMLQWGVDKMQYLTDSRIAFLHFVSADQNEIELVTWSSDTLTHHYCKAAFDRHYPVSKAGIWVNSVTLKQPVIVNDYATAPGRKGLPEGHAYLERFISVPILDSGLVRMIIGVGNAERDYNEHDVETIKLFGYNLHRIVQRKQAMQEKLEEGRHIRNALENAIGAIAATLEQRDPYTAGHQRRVAKLAAAIATEMGLAADVVEGIHFGGLIHDIGKISVPAEILGKPGKLSHIEFDLIKIHAEAGYQIVKGIAFPWPVADMVHQHHERMDGSGYPSGLAGDQIIVEARILAVADVVEAMSANRPYRPGLGMEAALAEITRVRGTHLDPQAIDACLRIIGEQGFDFNE